jgi:hypothetical protein
MENTIKDLEKEQEENYKKLLKEQPPIYIDELLLKPNEIVFSKLDEGERFQVLTRYLNDLCTFTKSILQITADQYILIELLCKKQGIDVKAEKQAIAKRIKEQMDTNIEKSKEQIKNLKN